MSSHLDRERERKVRKKAIREGLEAWEKAHRKAFKVPPSDEERQAAKLDIARALDNPGTPVVVRRDSGDAPPMIPAQIGNGHRPAREMKEIGRFTEKGIELDEPASPDLALRLKFLFHSNRFQMAETHAEQLRHAQGALIGLLEAARIQDAHLEAPSVIAMIADIDDMLAGRAGRILQAVADPALPPMPERTEPSQRWIASAYVVALGLAVEKFTKESKEPLTKQPALRKVIDELEKAMHISLNTVWKDGNSDLTERFGGEHRTKLVNGKVPNAAKFVFNRLKKIIDGTPADTLKAEYPTWLAQAQAYIWQAKERPDTKRAPKGGSRRVQARERKLPLSTADEPPEADTRVRSRQRG